VLGFFESGERPATAEAIQEEIYNVGRAEPRYQDLKAKGATPERPGVSIEWFNTIYQVLLGEPRGPRFGSFVALYGVKETRALIRKALNGDLVREHEAFLKERQSNRAA
jgi:lysyl-tRNA synthetase class 1